MSILINRDTRLIVQGITGSEGSFHTRQMIEYGTKVAAGVTPGKGGQKFDDRIPIYNTMREAVEGEEGNASVIFVPPAFAADAIMEAVDAGVDVVICITEGIPTADMMKVHEFLKTKNTRLVGPNCPGLITPEECKVGIMPGFITRKGSVGLVSRSGTLTYEAVHQLSTRGIGQSTCMGIGGDPIIGTTFLDAFKLFNEDSETQAVVMIGEIGGSAEEEAAAYIKDNFSKPVVSFIAGQTAPPGKRMGHAGAIISGGSGTAAAKMKTLEEAGVHVCKSPAEIGRVMESVL